MVQTITIGRKPTGSGHDPDFGEMGANQVRASTFNALGQHVWIHTLGFEGGVQGAAGDVRVAVYDPDASRTPVDRLGYSNPALVSAVMGPDPAAALPYERSVSVADNALTNKAIMGYAGRRISLALWAGVAIRHGMAQASRLPSSVDEKRFFDRSGVATPPDPFGTASAYTAGHLTAWALADVNEAPRVPVNRALYDAATGVRQSGGTINTTTPYLESDFRDRNGAWGPGNDGRDCGDQLKKVRNIVRNATTGAVMWDHTYTVSSGERSANRAQRLYAGSALVRGQTYTWETAHADQFDEWGAFSDPLEFTVASAGFVALTGPSGRQTTLSPTIAGTWTHQSGLSTNAIRAIVRQDGAVIQTSALVSKTIANGAAFTATWADLGLNPLEWGGSYSVEVQGRDSSNVLTSYSARQSFTVNAAPGVPSSLAPAGGEIVTAPPVLRFTVTDPDNTAGTGLVAKAELLNASTGAVLATKSATHIGNGVWEVALVSGDLSLGYTTYRWRAYAGDGVVWSGGQTVEANAVRSVEASFVYALGPTVSISSPADGATVTTSTPTITFTSSEQAQQRAELIKGGVVVYDSGWITAASATPWVVPAGYLVNGDAFQVRITAKNGSGLTGSDTVPLTLSYTPPDPILNPQASLVALGMDAFANVVQVSWEQSTDPNFSRYFVYREDLADPVGEITSVSQTAFVDHTPATGRAYVYSVRQSVEVDSGEFILSDPAEASVEVRFSGIVLSSVTNPEGQRVTFAAWVTREHTLQGEEAEYRNWDAGAPTVYEDAASWYRSQVVVPIFTFNGVSGHTLRERFEAMVKAGGTYCYRDGYGRLRFLRIPRSSFRVTDLRKGRYTVTFDAVDVAWVQGVA